MCGYLKVRRVVRKKLEMKIIIIDRCVFQCNN